MFYPDELLTPAGGRPAALVRRQWRAVLALWVELDPDGPTYERESAWTEWVRRVPARELARRMAGRVAGNEVREITITRRSPDRARHRDARQDRPRRGDLPERFELRQAVEMPEMLFSVTKVDGPGQETEFVFLGRGWGHGVGLCQNGSFGMALAGADLRPDPAALLHGDRHRLLRNGVRRRPLDPVAFGGGRISP